MLAILENKQYMGRKEVKLRKETIGIFLWNLPALHILKNIEPNNMKIVISLLIFSNLKSCSNLDWYLNKQAWMNLVQTEFKSSTKLFDSIYSPYSNWVLKSLQERKAFANFRDAIFLGIICENGNKNWNDFFYLCHNL